jgi:serine O-acetyltransferase
MSLVQRRTRAADFEGGALWTSLVEAAELACREEPALRGVVETVILCHADLPGAVAGLLARELADDLLGVEPLREIAWTALADTEVTRTTIADLTAVIDRDPAAGGVLVPFLHYKGFHALQAHRVAHRLWRDGRRHLAQLLQARVSVRLAADIHPAVPIGSGVFIDHGTGVVVGETAVIGSNVSILQEVTLGGTGKERGDRHPKVHDGVLLGAGAKILGNIEVGRGAKVGAGSVVLRSVPPCATVAGVPARVVGWCKDAIPALDMDHALPD